MLETTHGEFELIKNNKDGFVLDDFNKRYLDVLGIYPFIVGDYAAGLLRLKGFSNANYKQIPDYIAESCAPGCAYYILKNPNFNLHINRKE